MRRPAGRWVLDTADRLSVRTPTVGQRGIRAPRLVDHVTLESGHEHRRIALGLDDDVPERVHHEGVPGVARGGLPDCHDVRRVLDRRSEEHTSELQSLMRISYAVFCLKKKKTHTHNQIRTITPK